MTSTQTVTVLFTDIVGSTELSSRLGPHETDRVRQTHFSLLRQALAAGNGQEVKNLGDGIMAVFPSPSTAVACAVAMQQAVDQHNRRSAEPLGLRVAMSCGEATFEDNDYFGDPVIEASRVCALCESGQILVTETVKTLAGRRCPHPIVVLGDRDLKGLSDPVSVCEVYWEPVTSTTGVPLPDRLETPSGSFFSFVGRQRELEGLVTAAKNTISGGRTVAFLCGEPGIGKTSLCRQLAQSANELGVCVLYGRSEEDLGASYQPFGEALTHLVVHADESLLSDHVAEHGGALLSLVPALAKRFPDVRPTLSADPDADRVRLFGAAVHLLALASAEGGLLFVVDDLHWADKASLQLLRHICASNQLTNVMVLGTYRDSELSAGDPLSDALASISRETPIERFDLLGLEDIEIISLMEGVAGHTMDQDGVDLAHAVKRETEGNPFFTTELLRHLGETGLVYQDDAGRWVASDDLYKKGLPQSVRQVVGQRVDRLGEDMRKVLSQAAVIGRDFDINVLAAVIDIDEDAVLDLIDSGVQAGLLVEIEGSPDRLSFAHALTQHTLYDDLGAARRARAHLKIADVLEQTYGTAPETRAADLARHFVAATKASDAMKALTYCKLAGNQALGELAPADALGWFAQALDLYVQVQSDDALKCDLLIGLGTAQRRVGDPAHRETLLEAASIARRIGDTERLVASALANNRGGVSVSGQVDEERVQVLEAALDALPARFTGDRALLLATLGTELHFGTDPERSRAFVAEALAIAHFLDDPVIFLRVTGQVHNTIQTPETLDDRLVDLDKSVSLAESLGDPLSGYVANTNRAIACLQGADQVGFDFHLDAAYEVAERLGEPFQRWAIRSWLSTRSLLKGDVAAAEQLTNEAFAIGSESVPEAMAVLGAQLVDIQSVKGALTELSEMAELLAAAAVDNPGLPAIRAGLARTYCELDRVHEARAVIGEDLSDGFARFPHDTTWITALACLSEICVHLEQTDRAPYLYEQLLPWHNQMVTMAAITVQGPVALHLGNLSTLLRRYEEAQAHFTEALEVSIRLEAPYWSARTELAWAKMLLNRRSRSDVANAERRLAAVVQSAQQFGFGLIERQTTAILAEER